MSTKRQFLPTTKLRLGRRAFLQQGTLLLAAATASGPSWVWADSEEMLGIGLLTDLHYADKPPAGTRHYRETPDKLAEAAKQFAQSKPALVIELGDLIDAAESVELELSYLATIDRQFAALVQDRHYVLGNHCVDTLTKAEFLARVERKRSYYSFDRGSFHFVILDACFRSDGKPYGRRNFEWTDANIAPAELEWLAADLEKNKLPTIVFVHQRLDVNNHHGVKNAAAAREILERSGKVWAVFQGHSHQNDWREINGIHYCTLAAMIEGTGAENNGYALLQLSAGGTLRLEGFRRQQSYDWSPSS